MGTMSGNTWTMVARTGRGKGSIDKFTLINSGYKILEASMEQTAKLAAEGRITNLGLENGVVVSTNGAMEKYTYVNSNEGRIEGKARPVVLNRIEKNGKLIGYVMFAHTGQIVKLSVADAVAMYNKYGISNGKIRHTEDGDIISSIKGNFELMIIDPDDGGSDDKSVVEAKVIFVGETEVKAERYSRSYVGILVGSESAAKLSKAVGKLRESNAELVGGLVKKVGDSVRKDMQIIRVGATSFYIVAGLEDVSKLRSEGFKVVKEDGKPVVFSKIIYEAAGDDFVELKAKVDSDKVIVLKEGNEVDINTFASGIKGKYKMLF